MRIKYSLLDCHTDTVAAIPHVVTTILSLPNDAHRDIQPARSTTADERWSLWSLVMAATAEADVDAILSM